MTDGQMAAFAIFIAILIFMTGSSYGKSRKNEELSKLKQQLQEIKANPPPNLELEYILKQCQIQNARYKQRIDKAITVYNEQIEQIHLYKVQIEELSRENTRLEEELKAAQNTISTQEEDIKSTKNRYKTIISRQQDNLKNQSLTIKSLHQQISELTSKLSDTETEIDSLLQAQRNFQKILPRFEKTKAYTIKPMKIYCDANNIFRDKKFAFTGVIPYLPRKFAMQYIVDNGGHCTDSVSNLTDYLVIGEDTYHTDSKQKSNKIQKADEVVANGGKVKKISYIEFIYMVDKNIQQTKG